MVSDSKDKKFKEGVIHLSPEDIDALARTMQDLGVTPDESQLNRELFRHFSAQTTERSLSRDPTSLDDKELWSRIQKASQATPAPVTRFKPKGRTFATWSVVLAAAAGILLTVRPWGTELDPTDPELNFKHKGTIIKEGQFQTKACLLAVKANGSIVDPESKEVKIPASIPILLIARCKQSGYLHLQLKAGSDQVTLPNIKVEASQDWQELYDQNQIPLGVMSPATGQLQVKYGMSAAILSPQQIGQLESDRDLQQHEEWLWIRQVQWFISEQGARP